MDSKLKFGAYPPASVSSLIHSSTSLSPVTLDFHEPTSFIISYTWVRSWDTCLFLSRLFHLIQCPVGSSLLSWMLSSLPFWDHSCEYVNTSWNNVSLVFCCSVTPMTQPLWQVLYGTGAELVILLDELISVPLCRYPVLGFLDHILLLFLVFGITDLLFFFE